MNSQVVKRSIVIHGHKTSVSLEDAFWTGLREIAQAQHTTLSTLVEELDKRANKATYPQRSACSYSIKSAGLGQARWRRGTC